MKKLSKLSLLGEMDLLSKAELRQLIGSGDGGCPSTKDECTGQTCTPWGGEGGKAHCRWRENDMIKACQCEPDEQMLSDGYGYGYGPGGYF